MNAAKEHQTTFHSNPTWAIVPLLLALVLVAISVLVSPAIATAKGKPDKDPPPPTDPPPVQYQLTWLDNIWGPDWSIRAVDMNDSGSVVGNASRDDVYHAFAFVAGVMLDLNDIGATWSDLDDPGEPAISWVATHALGINNLGQIVGTADRPTVPGRRAFLLDFGDGAQPHFTLLPAVGNGENVGCAINDLGVIVGGLLVGSSEATVYTPWSGYAGVALGMELRGPADINNLGEIVTRAGFFAAPGTSGDYTPGAFTQTTNRWFEAINDAGQISGSREKTTGKNRQPGGSIRIDAATSAEQLLKSGSKGDFSADLNEQGDVCFTNGGRGYVYTDLDGTLALDDLVVNADADWSGLTIQPWAINAPDSTGFGQICGQAGQFFYRSFILTPEPPPSN